MIEVGSPCGATEPSSALFAAFRSIAPRVIGALTSTTLIALSAGCSTTLRHKGLDVAPLVRTVDRNDDGCMSADEWFGAGLPRSAYLGLRNEAGCVTEAAMKRTAPPGGIDLNGDGKLTVDEMIEYDRKASAPSSRP